jgi:hypothetical protein
MPCVQIKSSLMMRNAILAVAFILSIANLCTSVPTATHVTERALLTSQEELSVKYKPVTKPPYIPIFTL